MDFLGTSTSIKGQRLLEGTNANHSGETTGAAYLFQDDGTGAWVQTAKLIASDAAPHSGFAASVAINGDTAVVGAVHAEPLDAGAAYVFQSDGSGSWTATAKLTTENPSVGGFFGESVAIQGRTVLVGAASSAAVHLFHEDAAGVWNPTGALRPADPTDVYRFGTSVAISGRNALVGATLDSWEGAGFRVGVSLPSARAGYIWAIDSFRRHHDCEPEATCK